MLGPLNLARLILFCTSLMLLDGRTQAFPGVSITNATDRICSVMLLSPAGPVEGFMCMALTDPITFAWYVAAFSRGTKEKPVELSMWTLYGPLLNAANRISVWPIWLPIDVHKANVLCAMVMVLRIVAEVHVCLAGLSFLSCGQCSCAGFGTGLVAVVYTFLATITLVEAGAGLSSCTAMLIVGASGAACLGLLWMPRDSHVVL